MTSTSKGTPRPTLESTTPAVRNPGVTVELEPGGVSGGGREIRNKVKLLGYSYRCVVALQVYWYGNSTYMYTKLTFCGYTMKTIPKQVNFFYFCQGATPMTTLSDECVHRDVWCCYTNSNV